ncbi:MAG: putative copper export protein [Alphaproteobacteria bacterium]
MDELAVARAIHVVVIVVWIGGLAMETMVLLPIAKATDKGIFERTEQLFAPIARIATLLAGGSGFYMIYALDLWDRFAQIEYWWMHAMTAIWAIFSLVLFVLEPWFLHEWFERRMAKDQVGTLA